MTADTLTAPQVETPPAGLPADLVETEAIATTSRTGGPLPWASIRHQMRHITKPVLATAAVGVAGSLASQPTVPAAPFWLAIPAALAAVPLVPARWLVPDADGGERKSRLVARRRRSVAYCTAAACTWTAMAASTGLDLHTWPGKVTAALLLPAAALAGRPYVRYWRTRKPEPPTLADDAPEQAPSRRAEIERQILARWDTVLAAPGKPLVGAALRELAPIVGGWRGTIMVTDTANLDPAKLTGTTVLGRIALAYKVGVSAVTITADPADASRYHVFVQPQSPLTKTIDYQGQSIDLTTGRGETATMADGSRVEHTWWRPGWGAVMQLLAGCTGSGKSEYLNLLLAMERRSGMVVSWVCDPQLGQTLGDMRDGLDWFAPTTEELLTMLRCAKRVMLARNVLLTRMRVADERGRKHRVKYLDPTPDRPLITITIDEGHIPLNDPVHGKEIVKLLALLAKSGRKANILVRVLLQSTLLSEVRDSVLRSQLASLVTVFRTTDRLDGNGVWPGRMPVDPADLPATWPDGSTTAGIGFMSGQRPMMLRADFPGDLYDVVREGDTLGIEDAVKAAAGVDYADRAKRLAAFDDMDPADLLGAVAASMAVEDRSQEVPATGREAVLRLLAEHDAPMAFGDIAAAVTDVVKTRQLTNVVRKLTGDGAVFNDGGSYVITDEGRREAGVD